MKNAACLALGFVSVCLFTFGLHASEGHHQSGIVGRVTGGIITATPTGQGSAVHPDHVQIYADRGTLIATVETKVVANDWWHFEITLKPGDYVLVAYAGAGPQSSLSSYPVAVTVEKKQFANVAISFRPL